jgi:hypothetical protein
MYNNPQGTGLYIVFKFNNDDLDTGSYSGSYARKPPARTYNTVGAAKQQWGRFRREGYGARAAEIWVDLEAGEVSARWIDDDWVLKPELCKHSSRVHSEKSCWTYETCYRRKGHSGIHWSGSEAKKDPDYDPEKAMKETSDV